MSTIIVVARVIFPQLDSLRQRRLIDFYIHFFEHGQNFIYNFIFFLVNCKLTKHMNFYIDGESLKQNFENGCIH